MGAEKGKERVVGGWVGGHVGSVWACEWLCAGATRSGLCVLGATDQLKWFFVTKMVLCHKTLLY